MMPCGPSVHTIAGPTLHRAVAVGITPTSNACETACGLTLAGLWELHVGSVAEVLGRVVRPNGRIGFVHYIVPNAPRGCRFIKAFGLSMGFGYPMRAVTIFERECALLAFGDGAP